MLINIQLLRFVAALLVVLYHAATHVKATGVEPGLIFAASEALGFAGVDIFFLISGFIMFYTTREQQGVGNSRQFLGKRLARIFSGYWPFFFMAWAVFAWARPEHLQDIRYVESFFLWPVPLNLLLLDVSWTLTYELYFYALFAVLLLISDTNRWRIMAVFLAGFFVYNLWRHFAWQDFTGDNLFNHSFAELFLMSPFLLQFFAGAVLARFSTGGSERLGWLLLIVGIIGFSAAGFANVWIYEGNIEQGYHLIPRVLWFGVPGAMILLGLVWLEERGRVAPSRFALKAGGASYAIYLSHTLIQAITMKLGLNQALEGYSSWTIELVFLLHSFIVVLFSIGWYLWAEKPLHRAFRRVLRV